MKERRKIIIITVFAVIAVALLILALFATLSYEYDNAEAYSVGEADLAATQIESISIDWIQGNITLEPSQDDRVTVSEIGTREEEEQLHWLLSDGVLDIRYCADGILPGTMTKQLNITLPADLLKKLDITTVQASVTCNGISFIQGNIETATGVITLVKGRMEELTAVTQDAGISIIGEVDKLTVGNRKGESHIRLSATPNSITYVADKGDLTLTLPEKSEFTAAFRSKEGTLINQFFGEAKDGLLTVGKGTAAFDFSTVEGNVTLKY